MEVVPELPRVKKKKKVNKTIEAVFNQTIHLETQGSSVAQWLAQYITARMFRLDSSVFSKDHLQIPLTVHDTHGR